MFSCDNRFSIGISRGEVAESSASSARLLSRSMLCVEPVTKRMIGEIENCEWFFFVIRSNYFDWIRFGMVCRFMFEDIAT